MNCYYDVYECDGYDAEPTLGEVALCIASVPLIPAFELYARHICTEEGGTRFRRVVGRARGLSGRFVNGLDLEFTRRIIGLD
tara:strand:+ start:310 stop:555 length:246 start_codon:yes stop_codon:yes gene_type:complete